MSVPNQDLDFQLHMSWSFCVHQVQLKGEVVVSFVDIGGIVDHHCLEVIVRFVGKGELMTITVLTFFS